MQKNVVWGIGYYGRLCVIQLGIDNIAFFIDSDRNKGGRFLGKPVFAPDKVTDWTDLHLFVPFNYKDEIYGYLSQRNIILSVSISVYGDVALLTQALAQREYERAIGELENTDLTEYNGEAVFWARAWATGRDYSNGYIDFIKSRRILIISEVFWMQKSEAEQQLKNKTIVAPSFSSCESVYVKHAHLEDRLSEDIGEQEGIKNFVECILQTRPDISEEAALYKAYKTYEFANEVLRKGKFKYAIINGADAPEHKPISWLCRKRGIPVLYTHPAVLPGTIAFDPSGDVGDSLPSVYYKAFHRLPITEENLKFAKQVWDYLYKSKLNRKPQPKNDWIASIQDKLKQGRPIIFFAGQNDIVCSMVPYTDDSRRFQSPIFQSTFEAAEFLAKICSENNWNFIYKPHPMYIRKEDRFLPKNVIYVAAGNINDMIDFSDVTVTIRSTTNYVSLIRRKPVLMLGYTQTRGQGCTYEAFAKEDIEHQLRLAVEKGFTKEQQQAFAEHVARLLQYYLYDDMSERQLRYGLPMPEKFEEFFVLEKMLKAMI